jgi:hypothetical protein
MANPEHLEIRRQGSLSGRKPDLYQGTTLRQAQGRLSSRAQSGSLDLVITKERERAERLSATEGSAFATRFEKQIPRGPKPARNDKN